MITSNDFVWFSLVLDESTVEEDTAQLLIFIRRINKNFVITKKLLGLESMKDTSTGKDLFEHAVHCVKKIAYPGTKLQALQQMGPKLSLEKMRA